MKPACNNCIYLQADKEIINEQIENALNQTMYEFKYFKMSDSKRTVCMDWCTESNFADAHPGVIVISQTN